MSHDYVAIFVGAYILIMVVIAIWVNLKIREWDKKRANVIDKALKIYDAIDLMETNRKEARKKILEVLDEPLV